MSLRSHILLASALLPLAAMSQTMIDGMTLSRQELNGTARFMSMGGAFGALGGDLSTLTQNPAGIGVYRSSDIGVTLNINAMSTTSESQGVEKKMTKTNALCPNFGFVATWNLDNEVMPYLNWGFSYGRMQNLTRHYKGEIPRLGGSLSNYVAGYTSKGNWTPDDLLSSTTHDPYASTAAPWMSILMFNGLEINPAAGGGYQGLYTNDSNAKGYFYNEQNGYVDEYSLNMGGNFINTIYWGFGLGITDVEFDQYNYYGEDIYNGAMPYKDAKGDISTTAPGDGYFDLDSYKHIWGSGVNLKFGLIYKPIDELRLGFAVHTPTWYSLQQESSATIGGKFKSATDAGESEIQWSTFTNDGVQDYLQWQLNTPWRMMFSAAGVIGSKAIISADYEFRPYKDMKIQDNDGNDFIVPNEDVANYSKTMNILRVGAEYRVTPSFSVRAGYSLVTSPVKGEREVNALMADPRTRVATDNPYETGTMPSFTLSDNTNYITCGLGYRYKAFYADAAYVYRTHSMTYRPWSEGGVATAKINEHDSNVVLTAGLRF